MACGSRTWFIDRIQLAGWEAGLASVVIIVGCGVFKHYTLKNAREELQKSIEHRDGLFYRED